MHETSPTDSFLLGEWQHRGCERSFRALVERYAGLVHHAAKHRSGDESLAAEAAQATFILLARKAGELTGRSSLAGWLHLTAGHLARNLQRSQLREKRKRQEFGAHPLVAAEDVWHDMRPELDRALATLSEADRVAVLLRYYRSLSVKEVAHKLKISPEAAQKRLVRATARLRDTLRKRPCPSPLLVRSQAA